MAVQPEACLSCGTQFWMLRYLRTGKSNPIECEPTAGGNVLVDLEAGTYSIVPASQLAAARQDPERRRQLHISHFVGCPAAPSYRRRP